MNKGVNPWDVQGYIPLKQGVQQGDLLTFGFYARAVQPRKAIRLLVRFQRNGPPYDGKMDGSVDVGPEWRFVCAGGVAGQSINAAELVAVVQFAEEKRVVEVGHTLPPAFRRARRLRNRDCRAARLRGT